MDKGTEHKSAKRPLVLAVCSKFRRYSSYKNLRIDMLSSSASLCRWRKQNIRPWNFGAGLPCEIFFRNVTPALYLVGSQQDTSMSVWLLPYKQWPCNYKLHCIFHLVTKATFFPITAQGTVTAPAENWTSSYRASLQKELNFYTWSGNYTNVYHGVTQANGRIKQDITKKTQLYILWRNEIKCWCFEEGHTSGGIHTYIYMNTNIEGTNTGSTITCVSLFWFIPLCYTEYK